MFILLHYHFLDSIRKKFFKFFPAILTKNLKNAKKG